MSDKLTTLYKPCGKAMKVNDNSLAYAKSLGWLTKAEKDAKEKAEKDAKEKAEKDAKEKAEKDAK